MRPDLKILLLAVLIAATNTASGATRTVKVAITSVSGRDVFIDKGSGAGIVLGLRVRFFPAGSTPVEGVVLDVATRSCRVELNQGIIPPPVGTEGQLEVPEAPHPATQPTTTEPWTPNAIPPHPPWSRQEEARSLDTPLLAPAFSIPPSARASTYHGRIFTDFGATFDQAAGANNKYLLGRAGTALTVTNPFGQGGTFQFQGEYDFRGAYVGGSGNTTANDFILQRASYAIGEEDYSPGRLEVGRFYSVYLPELGQIDGVEGALRLGNGFSAGGALGAYPRPFPNNQEGEDIGFDAFVDYKSSDQKKVSGTIGFEKTWHNLAPDRDLLVGHGSIWLSKDLWLYGSARADIYGSSEKLKSPGPQLTDAWVQARYAPSTKWGIGASYAHYSWADIKQNEFGLVPLDLIQHGKVDRIELSTWRDLATNVRGTIRGNYFDDYKGSGYGGQLDLDWTHIYKNIDLHMDGFYNHGSFSDDMGFRTEGRLHSEKYTTFVGYELYRYGAIGGLQTGTELIRHTVRAGVNWQRDNMYYNLAAERYFGDRDNAYALRAYVEFRF